MLFSPYTGVNPTCSDDVRSDRILLAGEIIVVTCKIQYGGNRTPRLIGKDSEGFVVTAEAAYRFDSQFDVTCTLNMTVARNHDGLALSVTLDFGLIQDVDELGNQWAMNTPNYQYIHNIDTIRVHCKFYCLSCAVIAPPPHPPPPSARF